MRVLVACEYSGTVRDAFIEAGHQAVSVDILPTESKLGGYKPGAYHYQGDIFEFLRIWDEQGNEPFDLMIAHPPCTHLSVSGQWAYGPKSNKPLHLKFEALAFVARLMAVDIPRICIENPVSIIAGQIRKSDQTIQPFEFGHLEQKRTCLWLKNLPILEPTNNVYDEMILLPKKEYQRVLWLGSGKGKERSIFFRGIAEAMANQWGSLE